MDACSQSARKEDALDDASIGQVHHAAIQSGRLAALHAVEDCLRHAVQLALYSNSLFVLSTGFEHARVDVTDRIEAVSRGSRAGLEELSAGEIGVQRQPAHQGAVYEQVDAHSDTPVDIPCSTPSEPGHGEPLHLHLIAIATGE